MKRRILCCVMALAIVLGLSSGVGAVGTDDTLAAATNAVLQYLVETVPKAENAQIGGEWAVLAIARGEFNVHPKYYARYYQDVEETAASVEGILHTKKYTEYSRTIVGLSAIGKDARDVAGYDLTRPLGDYDMTIWQGLNGPIWALIALDTAEYPMPVEPEAATHATRQMYIDYILSQQLSDGGWTLAGTSADVDMTAMALQALAKYSSQSSVEAAVERAVTRLGEMQALNGGYINMDGDENSESVAQVIVALCELGIPLDDARFVKGGHTLLDNLLTFQDSSGGFRHTLSGGLDGMSTEQGAYALVAAQRVKEGKSSLYRMSGTTDMTAGGDAPEITDGRGTPASYTLDPDGSTTVTITTGSSTIRLSGRDGSYTVESTGDMACTIIKKSGDSWVHLTVTTEDGTHTVTLSNTEEYVFAVKGDVNGDGGLDIVDVVQCKASSLGKLSLAAIQNAIGDVNGDGIVDIVDVVRVKAAQLGKAGLPW